jgi:hypothetical protein
MKIRFKYLVSNDFFNWIFLTFWTLAGFGCSLGTEVGNGNKPKPGPTPPTQTQTPAQMPTQDPPATASSPDEESKKSQAQESDSNDKSMPESNAPTTASTSTRGLSTTELIYNLLLNPCASPWTISNLQKPLSMMAASVVLGGAPLKIAVNRPDVNDQNIFEWGQPASGRYGIKSAPGSSPLKAEIIDLSSGLPTLIGAAVGCGTPLIQNGPLLGAEIGSVQGTTVDLRLQGQTYSLNWYLKDTPPTITMVLLRIVIPSQGLTVDFKPL